jgi:hypothetical protein
MDSRLTYPKINFGPYDPNHAAQPNYSALSGTRYYYRSYYDTGVNHTNGTFLFMDYNITEANLASGDVTLQVSCDGANWFNLNSLYLGGALSNGSGCRINPETVALDINNEVQFTLGSGLFTSAATGGGWGVWVEIGYAATTAGKAAYIGALEIEDW